MKLISKWIAVHRSYLSKEAKGNLEMGNYFITQEHRFSNKGEGVTLRDNQSTYKVVMSPPMLHSSWMQTRPLFKHFSKINRWLVLASIGGMWPNCSLKVLKMPNFLSLDKRINSLQKELFLSNPNKTRFLKIGKNTFSPQKLLNKRQCYFQFLSNLKDTLTKEWK